MMQTASISQVLAPRLRLRFKKQIQISHRNIEAANVRLFCAAAPVVGHRRALEVTVVLGLRVKSPAPTEARPLRVPEVPNHARPFPHDHPHR